MDSKSPSAVKASAFQTATHLAHRGLAALLVATVATATAEAAGDAARGEALYRDCQACHSFDKNQIGPMHRGVVGRAAGTVAGFDYSEALKNAGIVWTEANLDKWLADPEVLVPGSKMYFSVDKAGDRADLIAFLKERAK
ncbi:c-type cytochrome [Bradyrhizobium sp.]|uniref:c-type cytochrome n=1 Tax=Bradyrhizobium sp. TaxID=376 RepID=UPI001DAAC9E9|nr:c-type cytochrome [Bradyrhizobium sp.]MBV8698685.1 c-type cytochrome [Bradyrhizobium sp.]MBV8921812.1 c-type cytochrome [Bradyrhizobium sp.]MBV9981940.1 c-type cytochrome [Bradyrhizobium sp.]